MGRAVVADMLGGIENYSLRDHEPGAPGPGEVRIAVRAIGVSFVDVLVATGRYQVRPEVPFIPGSEVAGLVEAVGDGVQGLSVGQRVAATGWHGMYADVVVAPAGAVWPIPERLSFEEASVTLISYATAWHALADRAQLQPGESLLVLGAGGATGLAAVQLGAWLGARVIASASSEAKRDAALAAGASVAVASGSAAWRDEVRSANGGQPIDVVFDPVGGPATERAFRTLGWNGRHLVVGFPAGIPALPTNLPLLKGASLVGVLLAGVGEAQAALARSNHLKVLGLAAEGVVRPAIARTYALEEFAAAMRQAQAGESAGRIVLLP